MTVLIYVDTGKQVGDPEHLKALAAPGGPLPGPDQPLAVAAILRWISEVLERHEPDKAQRRKDR
ncbi:hypothetical protein [Bradyrhizobium sp. URHC0002]|jgi:hypothetical protein